jgi:hypothetical protein
VGPHGSPRLAAVNAAWPLVANPLGVGL